MSQNTRILAHLQRGRNINRLQALNNFGCMRLARVINDLRNLGFDITTKMVPRGSSSYASYSLGESK